MKIACGFFYGEHNGHLNIVIMSSSLHYRIRVCEINCCYSSMDLCFKDVHCPVTGTALEHHLCLKDTILLFL